MGISFQGVSLTAGIFVISGANGTLTNGAINGVPCDMNDPTCVGISFDPFSVTLEGDGCEDCVPQKGDWIKISATTLLFIDITTYEWWLCGGKCHGSMTRPGFALGLGIKFAKWTV